MKDKKTATIAGLAVIAALVVFSPFDSEEGEFSKVLRSMGSNQIETSEKFAEHTVKPFEGGSIIGEHKVNGSNWAIPNIIRNILGVNK